MLSLTSTLLNSPCIVTQAEKLNINKPIHRIRAYCNNYT